MRSNDPKASLGRMFVTALTIVGTVTALAIVGTVIIALWAPPEVATPAVSALVDIIEALLKALRLRWIRFW